MIRAAGDFTGKLVERLHTAKQSLLKAQDVKGNIYEEHKGDDNMSKLQSKIYYPTINISRPVTSPADSANF